MRLSGIEAGSSASQHTHHGLGVLLLYLPQQLQLLLLQHSCCCCRRRLRVLLLVVLLQQLLHLRQARPRSRVRQRGAQRRRCRRRLLLRRHGLQRSLQHRSCGGGALHSSSTGQGSVAVRNLQLLHPR